MKRVAAIVATAIGVSACAPHDGLDGFERLLAANDSATAALAAWCEARGIASDPEILAIPVVGGERAEPGDLRRLLGVAPDQPLGYRHVRLTCGGTVLSEAHNWYVPARLTPAMNARLAATHDSFGKVAAPLGFRRERLKSTRGGGADCPAGTILAHRALLRLPDRQPLALLLECYTPANLTTG